MFIRRQEAGEEIGDWRLRLDTGEETENRRRLINNLMN